MEEEQGNPLVGQNIEAIIPILTASNICYRIVQEGNIVYFVTADHNPNRINLRLDSDNVVTDAYLG